MNKVLLIDTKYFLYRTLTDQFNLTHNEIKTGCLFGLLQSIVSMKKQLKPDKIILMNDSEYSYRKEIYPQYKEKRNKIKNENILIQIKYIKENYPIIRRKLKKIGFNSYYIRGLEADDLFAMYCNQFSENMITIASKDGDLYQLLSDNVIMYDPQKKQKITRQWFTNTYGIKPKDWVKVKEIIGCKTDNISSIKRGIGEKTALKYIIEKNNKNLEEIIENNKKTLQLNRKLVELPFKPKNKTLLLKHQNRKINIDLLIDLFQEYGFKSFLQKIDFWKTF